MWSFVRRKIRRVRTRTRTVSKHYVAHKKQARELALARLAHFNTHYNFSWKRVAIRNQRRVWGSCSSLKNLNFNYKIVLLPEHLRDYIIVHEMCHLAHLNHGQDFWNKVGEQIPDYRRCVAELRAIDKLGHSVTVLTAVQDRYQSYAKELEKQLSETEPTSLSSIESCGHSVV